MGGKATSTDLDAAPSIEPARVYPSPDGPDRWVVEAPTAEPAREPVTFNGPNAQTQALRYAYEMFGSARFFPF